MISELRSVFDRDLAATAAEVEAYLDDASLWREVPGITNTGGTLVLHMVGNLRHYIGAQIGGSGYVRDRAAEFGDRDIGRDRLIDLVAASRKEVDAGLTTLTPEALAKPVTTPSGDQLSNGLWLMHLAVHLAYHLGQLDYHRRVVSGDGRTVETMSLRALAR